MSKRGQRDLLVHKKACHSHEMTGFASS